MIHGDDVPSTWSCGPLRSSPPVIEIAARLLADIVKSQNLPIVSWQASVVSVASVGFVRRTTLASALHSVLTSVTRKAVALPSWMSQGMLVPFAAPQVRPTVTGGGVTTPPPPGSPGLDGSFLQATTRPS